MGRSSIHPAVICLCLVLICTAVYAEAHHDSESLPPDPEMMPPPVIPPNAPRWQPRDGELDEIIGDTLFVGHTYWESQHNCTIGRMIGFEPDGDNGPTVHLVWTDLYAEAGNRHVKYVRAWTDGNQMEYDFFDGYVVDGGIWAGYPTLAFDSDNGRGFPVYHTREVEGGTYNSAIAWEANPGDFDEAHIDNAPGQEDIWPRQCYAYYDDTHYIHTLSHEYPNTPKDVYYTRSTYDPGDNEVTAGEPEYVCDVVDLSPDIAASDDGERVAIAAAVAVDGNSQFNSEIYLWVSEDGGDTWDFEEPVELTPWDDDDTTRAYCDVNVYFDHDDILHVAFTVHGWSNNAATNTSHIYHWDEESDVYTRCADGWFQDTNCGSWQRRVQRPSMYQDPDSGVLWMVFQRYGDPDNLNDQSDDGYPNGEAMVTASPPSYGFYGRLWSEAVNITNTQWEDVGGAPIGECRSELEPHVALNNDGDYLNIYYILDLDAGFATQNEGGFTQNPVVWHRVSKDELIDEMEAIGAWLENHPLFMDSTGHWEDPYAYDWDDHNGTFFVDDLPPPDMDILTDTPIEFGEVMINTSDTVWVSIENTGEILDVVIDSVVLTGDTVFSTGEIEGWHIPHGEIDSFWVAFAPVEITEYTGSMTLYHNIPETEPVEIGTSGEGSPLPRPYNVAAELDTYTGEVTLSWDFNGNELDEFIEFQVIRNDEWNPIYTGTETTCRDDLSDLDEGEYVYEIIAVWDEGDSDPSDPVQVDWSLPAPRDLAGEVNQRSGIVTLTWEHDWGRYLAYDMFGPQGGVQHIGRAMGVRMSPEMNCKLLKLMFFTYVQGQNNTFTARIHGWNAEDEHPTSGMLYDWENVEAVHNGWTVLDVSGEDIYFDSDFTLAFGSVNEGVEIGYNSNFNNQMSWDWNGAQWQLYQGMYFIRALVQYTNEEVELFAPEPVRPPVVAGETNRILTPRESPGFGADDELDEFEEYVIYRDDEIVGWSSVVTYTDTLLEDGSYMYRVAANFSQGATDVAGPVQIDYEHVAVESGLYNGIPEEWALAAVYPNPFNPTVTAVVAVPKAAKVKAEIFDLLGRKIAEVDHGRLQPGYHRLAWTAAGPSGVYFLAVSSDDGWKEMRKIVFIK